MKKKRLSDMIKRDHTVIVHDFFGEGQNLEAYQLGWNLDSKLEAKSCVSKKIFDFYIEEMGMNMIFYYVEDGNFYGIHTEICPTPFFRFKKFPCKYTNDALEGQDTHDYQDGEILYWVEENQKIWDVVKINGKSLEEVIQNSYIVVIN
jgi:hypothetical protein